MFFHTSKMTKSSQKKGQNYIPFCNLHTQKCKENILQWAGGSAARQSGAPGGRGGSSRTPERLATPAHSGQGELRPRARPARATLAPSGQGGLRLCVRAAHVPPAPSCQGGSGRAPERRVCPRPPVCRGNSGRMPDQLARP